MRQVRPPAARRPGTTKYLLGDLYETDGSGNITQTADDSPYGNLASFNGPPTTGTTSYLYYDAHGNRISEANSNGTATDTQLYDPWGAPLSSVPADQNHPCVRRRLRCAVRLLPPAA